MGRIHKIAGRKVTALASAVFSPLSTAWGAIDPCKAFCNQCPQSKRSQCLSACRACNGNTFHLTKAALAKLAATCESKDTRELTIVVDGKHWGVYRYEKDKDKPSIAEEVRAETFRPSVGYFTSKVEAERLANAFK
jgi:hypothetical protein